jgi:hypothetical protein
MRSTPRCAIVAAAALILGAASHTPALVVRGNRMPDPAGNGVGWWRGATAVAIGPNHILTARHLGGAPGDGFILDGKTYESLAIHVHPNADLAIVRVKGDIPSWHAIANRAKKGSNVYIGGFGRVAGVEQADGITWSNLREERWGRNKLNKVVAGFFEIKFDKNRRLVNEAQFAHGDSGAGVFVLTGGTLQLVGIATNVQGSEIAAWGSKGVGVDVTTYRAWIESVMTAQ